LLPAVLVGTALIACEPTTEPIPDELLNRPGFSGDLVT
jgi:hypothetical protein